MTVMLGLQAAGKNTGQSVDKQMQAGCGGSSGR